MAISPAPTIAVLPVGELDAASVTSEFDAKLAALRDMGAQLLLAAPVSDAASAQQTVGQWAEHKPDLLLIIGLRGLSAPAQEAAAQASLAPCLLWPVQGHYALPSSALARGAVDASAGRQSYAPLELLYGPPDHPRTLERLSVVARAATAYSRIRRSRVGIVGGLFPNLVACRYDAEIIRARLGVTALPLSYDAIRAALRRSREPSAEIETAREALVADYAIAAPDEPALAAGLSLHAALKHIAAEQHLDGFATECWSGLPGALGLNPCLGFTEDAYALACEGDVMACVALLLVRYLMGANAYVGDIYDLDLDGDLTLIHCGGPASLAAKKSETILARSQPALQRGFETVTCRPRPRSGPVTLVRFYGPNCDQMHVALGELLNSDQSPSLSLTVHIQGDRWDFLDHCLGNHYLAAPGDVCHELALLCHWLGIVLHET